jgi:hypothetical protein
MLSALATPARASGLLLGVETVPIRAASLLLGSTAKAIPIP